MNFAKAILFCGVIAVGNLNAQRSGYGTAWTFIQETAPRITSAIATIPTRLYYATHRAQYGALTVGVLWAAKQTFKQLQRAYNQGPEDPYNSREIKEIMFGTKEILFPTCDSCGIKHLSSYQDKINRSIELLKNGTLIKFTIMPENDAVLPHGHAEDASKSDEERMVAGFSEYSTPFFEAIEDALKKDDLLKNFLQVSQKNLKIDPFYQASQIYSLKSEKLDALDSNSQFLGSKTLTTLKNKLSHYTSLAILGTSTVALAGISAFCFYRTIRLSETIAGHPVKLLN